MFDVLTPQVWTLIGNATLETLYMVFASGFFSAVFGIPLGVILFITRPGQIKEIYYVDFRHFYWNNRRYRAVDYFRYSIYGAFG